MLTIDELATSIESFPAVLRGLLSPVEPDALTARPAPGEWCVLEVIGHLIDCEQRAFLDRVQGLADGAESVDGFDPRPGMEARDFAAESLDALLGELEGLRAESAAALRALEPGQLARTGSVGRDNGFAAGDFAHEWPYHDQAHLIQIIEALKPNYLDHMTDTMRGALVALGL